MRISELENGLKEIRERCGDCLVMATDENIDSERGFSRLQLSESVATNRLGKKQSVAHLAILSSDSEPDEDVADESEDQETLSDALEELSETNDQLIKVMNLCMTSVSKQLKKLEKAFKNSLINGR